MDSTPPTQTYYSYLILLQNDLLGVEARFRAAMAHFLNNMANLVRRCGVYDRLKGQVDAIVMLFQLDRMIEEFLPMAPYFDTIDHISVPNEDVKILLVVAQMIEVKKIEVMARLPGFESDQAFLYQQCEAAPAAPEQNTPDQADLDQ
jgi:hypothetical protein